MNVLTNLSLYILYVSVPFQPVFSFLVVTHLVVCRRSWKAEAVFGIKHSVIHHGVLLVGAEEVLNWGQRPFDPG